MIDALAFLFLLFVSIWAIATLLVGVFALRIMLPILTILAIYILYDSPIFK